jgi:hypothetical protein
LGTDRCFVEALKEYLLPFGEVDLNAQAGHIGRLNSPDSQATGVIDDKDFTGGIGSVTGPRARLYSQDIGLGPPRGGAAATGQNRKFKNFPRAQGELLIAEEQRADRATVVGDLNAITTRRPEVERTAFKERVSFDFDSAD